MALTPEVRSTLESMGNDVRYIAAPDMEHHIFLGPWHKAYPQARVIGPEGLAEKRTSQKMKEKNEAVPFSTVFTRAAKRDLRVGDDFDRDFDYEYVDGHPSRELVFFHRPDRTLIQADLFFNMPATEQYSRTGASATAGFPSSLLARVMSTAGDARWQRRFIWYVLSGKDRPSFNDSIRRIDQWDFDRIIPCHGEVTESGGKGIFRKVFEWHLDTVRP